MAQVPNWDLVVMLIKLQTVAKLTELNLLDEHGNQPVQTFGHIYPVQMGKETVSVKPLPQLVH